MTPSLLAPRSTGQRIKRATPFAIALGIWFFPVPAGLTAPAWHLFAVFVAAIAWVLIGAFPLLTASMMAVGAIVLTETITPEQASRASPTRACCWWWSRSSSRRRW